MMISSKRSFALVLAVILVFSLLVVGCGEPAPEVKGALTANSDKMNKVYMVGDSVSFDKLAVKFTDEDGTKKTLTSGEYTLTVPDTSTSGRKKVTATYNGLEANFNVFVFEEIVNDAGVIQFNLGKDVNIMCYLVGNDKPFAISCPGGGYALVSTELEGIEFSKAFNEKGYNAFVLNYSVGDAKKLFPKPFEDLASAITLIQRNADKWQVSMDNYAVVGSSAGGHLALSWSVPEYGYEKYGLPKPTTNILCYTALDHYENYLITPKLTKDFTPAYIWGCENDDDCIWDECAGKLANKLAELGVPHRLNKVVGVTGKTHGLGLGIGTLAEGWFDEAVLFWESQMK